MEKTLLKFNNNYDLVLPQNVYTNQHSTQIGEVKTVALTANNTLTTTAKTIITLALPEGMWLLVGNVRVSPSDACVVSASMDKSTNAKDSVHIRQYCNTQGNQQLNFLRHISVAAGGETICLNAFVGGLPSGTTSITLNGTGNVRATSIEAVRIA